MQNRLGAKLFEITNHPIKMLSPMLGVTSNSPFPVKYSLSYIFLTHDHLGYYDIQFLFSKHIALPIPCEGKCSYMSCLDKWNIRGSEVCQL